MPKTITKKELLKLLAGYSDDISIELTVLASDLKKTHQFKTDDDTFYALGIADDHSADDDKKAIAFLTVPVAM